MKEKKKKSETKCFDCSNFSGSITEQMQYQRIHGTHEFSETSICTHEISHYKLWTIAMLSNDSRNDNKTVKTVQKRLRGLDIFGKI